MGQLIMYHLMDAFVEYPVPEGFAVRKFRRGEEAVWIDVPLKDFFDVNHLRGFLC